VFFSFSIDEVLSMAQEGLPDKDALQLAFPANIIDDANKQSNNNEINSEEDDEFGRPVAAAAEAPLKGLEKHEEKENQKKHQVWLVGWFCLFVCLFVFLFFCLID
jgi:hypothetical protein